MLARDNEAPTFITMGDAFCFEPFSLPGCSGIAGKLVKLVWE